ncbi:CorA metal ion transporter, partial [Coemansia erecta]
MQRMHSTVRDSDIYSQPSIGVRSSLVDTDSWYVQQKQQLKWRQQRASRIQSIAATGRDSFYAGVPSTPTYSTTSSSIRNSKADAIDIESATDFGDPVMDAHTGDAPASQIMLTGDNSQATTMGGVAPAFSTNNAKCQGTRDSSILWMHNAGSNAGSNAGGEQSQHAASPDARVRVQTVRPAGFRRSGSWHMGEHGGAFDALQSDRIMFYSSQTGAVRAQSLQKIAYQDMGLEPLVDAVQSGAIGGDGSEPCFWLDVSSATAHELHRLSEIFGLHPLTVEDIEQKCSRDKIDTFDDYQVIVYHTSAPRRRNRWQRYYSYCRVNSSIRPATRDKSKAHSHANSPNTDATLDMSDDEAGTGDDQILIVLKSSFVLTFHSGSQQDVVSDVLKRLLTISTVSRQEQDAAGSEIEPGADLLAGLVDYPAYIVYAILDQITDQLTPEIAKIEAQVDAIDELVLILSHAEHESVLQQMGEQRRQILRVWQLTQPKSE